MIGLASAGGTTLSDWIDVGLAIAYCVNNNPRTPGGEGAGSGGPFDAGQALPGLLNQAFPTGSTPPAYATGVLAGILVGDASNALSAAEDKLAALVGTSATAGSAAVATLATVLGTPTGLHSFELAHTIARLEVAANLGASGVAAAVAPLVANHTIGAADAVDMLARVVLHEPTIYPGKSLPLEAADFAPGIQALVASGAISLSDALDAVTSAGIGLTSLLSYGGPDGSIDLLAALAGADVSLIPTIGGRIAALVDPNAYGFVSPTFGHTNAASAVNDLRASSALGGLSASVAVLLMAGIGTLTGAATAANSPLHLVGDTIRGLVAGASLSGTAAADAIAAAGLTPAQALTVLAGVGANGAFQLSGFNGVYVPNADLESAASAKIAAIVAANPSLTGAQIGAAFAGALAADDLNLVRDVVVAAGFDLTSAADQQRFGAGIAAFAASGATSLLGSPITLGNLLGKIGAGSAGHDAAALQLLIGAAGGAADAASQVSVGQAIAGLTLSTLSFSDAATTIATALSGSPSAALLTLAGAAGQDGAANANLVVPAMTAAMATLLASGTSQLLSAFDGAVGSALPAATAIRVLAHTAGFAASVTEAQAITDEIVAIASRSPAVITPTAAEDALLSSLSVSTTGLVGAAAKAIVGSVSGSLLTATDAVSEVVTQLGTSLPHRAVAVLANLEAAGLAGAAVATGLGSLISSGDLTSTQVIADLNALLPGASSALQVAIQTEIAELSSSSGDLVTTAGLGTPAAVHDQAVQLAFVFLSNAAGAQPVLNALAARIEAASLTAAQAGLFLIDLYDQGGPAQNAALAKIVALSQTFAQNQSIADLPIGSVTSQIGDALSAGYLSAASAAGLLFGLRSVAPASAAQDALVQLLEGGQLTVPAFEAAVTGGILSGASAIVSLGDALASTSATVRSAVVAEVETLLGHDASLAPSALGFFVSLAGSASASERATAVAEIDAIGALPGDGRQAFAALLPLFGSGYPDVVAAAQAELVSLFSHGRLSSTDALSALSGETSPTGTHYLTGGQLLQVLVSLSGIGGQPFYDTIRSVLLQATPPFARADAIVAIAEEAAGHLGTSGPATSAIHDLATGLSPALTPSQVVDALGASSALTGPQVAALAAEIGGFDGATVSYGAAIAQHGLALTSFSSVVVAGGLSPENAVAILIGYAQGASSGRAAIVLAFDGLVQSGTLTTAKLISAITASHASSTEVIGLYGWLADHAAVSSIRAQLGLALEDIVTGGTAPTPGSIGADAVIAALEDPANGLSAADIVGVLGRMLAARADEGAANGLSGTAFANASYGLYYYAGQEILGLVSRGAVSAADAIAALAHAGPDVAAAGLATLADQIRSVGYDSGLTGVQTAAAVVTAAQGIDPITGPEAVSVLLALARNGTSEVQQAAGVGIATLISDGLVTASAALSAIHQVGFLDSTTAAVGAGLVQGGAFAAAGSLLNGLIGSTSLQDLGYLLDALLVPADAVAAGVAMTVDSGDIGRTFAVVDAVANNQHATRSELIADLGPRIGSGGLTAAQAVAVAVHLAAPLYDPGMAGAGAGELLAYGQLTGAQLLAGLQLAVSGDPAHGIAAQLTLAQAVAFLQGAADDPSAAAHAAHVADIATGLIGALSQGSDGSAVGATAIAVIEASLSAGTLTADEAVHRLIGLAASGDRALQTTVAAELAHLAETGLVGSSASTAAANTALIETKLGAALRAGEIGAAKAVFTLALLDGQHPTGTAGGLLRGLVHDGFAVASDAVTQIVQAEGAAPSLLPPAAAGRLLVDLGVAAVQSGQDLGIVGAVATGLVSLDASAGSSTLLASLRPSGVSADLYLPVFAKVLAASSDPTVAGHAVSAILGFLADTTPVAIVHGLEQGRVLGIVSAADTVSDLAKLAAASDSAAFRAAIGHDLATLVTGGVTTVAAVQSALLAADAAQSDATHAATITVLAAMLDPAAPSAAILSALDSAVVDSLAHSGDPVGLVHGAEPSLSGGQATLALTLAARDGVAGASATELAHLVDSGQIVARDAAASVARALLDGPSASAQPELTLLAGIAAAAGVGLAGLTGAITAAVGHGITADEAVRVLASLSSDFAPGASALSGNALGSETLIGQALASLVGNGLTLAQVMSDLAAAPVASDGDRLKILIGMIAAGAPATQAAAAQVDAPLAASVSQTTLTADLLELSSAARIVPVLASLSAAGSAALKETAGGIAASLAVTGQVSGAAASVDASVASGAISAADGIVFLAAFAAAETGSTSDLAIRRGAVDTEIAALVTGAGGATAVVAALAHAADVGSAALVDEIGGRIAAFSASGALSASAATQAVTGSGASDAHVVSLLAAAAAAGIGTGWTEAASGWIGAGLESGRLSISTVQAAESAALAYRGRDLGAVATLFIEIAGHGGTPVAAASGQVLVDLAAAGLPLATLSSLLSGAVAQAHLGADAAVALAAAAAQAGAGSSSVAALDLALGASLAAIVSGGQIDIAHTLADIRAAVTAGLASGTTAAKLMAGLAGSDAADHAAIAAALSGLVSAGVLTQAGVYAAIEAVLVGPNATSNAALGSLLADLGSSPPLAGDVAAGRELGSLVASGALTVAAALAAVTGAAGQGGDPGSIVATKLGLADTGGAAAAVAVGSDLGAALATNVGGGASAATTLLGQIAAATAAGGIQPGTLAVVSAAMASQEGPGRSAVDAATSELAALVASGAITAAAAMAAIDAAGTALAVRPLVHFLAELSATPSLAAAAKAELAQLVAEGRLTGADLAADIAEIATLTPAGVASGLALGGNAAASLLIDVAGAGDRTLQAALGAGLAPFVGTLGAAQVEADIEAAVSRGTLPGLAAIGVTASLIAALPAPSATAIGTWANGHLPGYATTAHLSVADAIRAIVAAAASASAASLAPLESLISAFGGGATGAYAIHEAILGGQLPLARGLDMLLAFGADQGTTGADPQGAIDVLLGLKSEGLITAADIDRLLIQIFGPGTGAIKGRVVDQLDSEIGAGSQTGVTIAIEADVGAGTLSSSDAVRLVLQLLGGVSSDSSGTFGAWVNAHLPGYAATAGVSTTSVVSTLLGEAHGASPTGRGEMYSLVSTLSGGTAALHDALVGHAGLQQGAIDILLAPNSTAGRSQILTLLGQGLLDAALVGSSALAAGQLSALRTPLLSSPQSDATIAALTTDLYNQAAYPPGISANVFTYGAVPEASWDYLKVQAGLMTVAQAEADIVAYGQSHHALAYEGLTALKGFFSQAGQTSNASTVNTYLQAYVAHGDLQEELSQNLIASNGYFDENVRPYVSPLLSAAGLRVQDTSSVTTESLVHYSQDVRHAAFSKSLIDGSAADYSAELTLELIIQHNSDPSYVSGARTLLANSLINGSAVDAALGYVAGYGGQADLGPTLAVIQKALDLAAPPGSTSDPVLARQLALAWIAYDAVGNYRPWADLYDQITPSHPNALVNYSTAQLRQQIEGSAYRDDVITGFGALLSLPYNGPSAVMSVKTHTAVAMAFQAYTADIYPPSSPSIQADVAALNAKTSDSGGSSGSGSGGGGGGGSSTNDKIVQLLSNGWDKTQGAANVLGVIHDKVATDPKSADGYVRVAAAIAGGKLASEISQSALGIAGSSLTGVSLGSKVALYALSQDVVADALGPGISSYLQVELLIFGSTAGLLSTALFNIGQKAVDIAEASGADFVAFGSAVRDGNPAGIATAAHELAVDYFRLTTGFDLHLEEQVVQDLGVFLVDLFSGNTGAFKDDLSRLGSNFGKIFAGNVYVGVIGQTFTKYAHDIDASLDKAAYNLQFFPGDVVRISNKIAGGATSLGDAIVGAAHTVGSFFGIHGYIVGATAFADTNLNGMLDPGEAIATSDASGHYTIVDAVGPIVLTGGTDSSTGLPFRGTLMAPSGSSVVSPLTTLVAKIAAPGDSNATAAKAYVAAALGLPDGTDVTALDPVTATMGGDAAGRAVFAQTAAIYGTASLLQAAGATGDVFDALAQAITSLPAGTQLDLTDAATISALGASLGLAGDVLSAATQVVTATNTLLDQTLHGASSGLDFLTTVASLSVDAEGSASAALRAAGSDPTALNAVVAAHTGAALQQAVIDHLKDVGSFDLTSKALIFGSFAHDASDPGGQVFELYTALLGRTPEPAGYEGWLDHMRHGESLVDVAAGIQASDEYLLAHSPASAGTDADYVRSLYISMLGRDVDPASAPIWAAALASGLSRAEVAADIATSLEHQALDHAALAAGVFAPDPAASDVSRLYYGILGRAPDADGLKFWTAQEKAGMSDHDVAQLILTSDEYGFHAPSVSSDAAFVAALYDGAVGHAPDPGGQGWLDALASGADRATVAMGISQSDEAMLHHVADIEKGWHVFV